MDNLTRCEFSMDGGKYEGEILHWGVDFEECNDGVGNFTTAIIEMDGGKVVTICSSKVIRMIQPEENTNVD